jgi:agmatinase
VEAQPGFAASRMRLCPAYPNSGHGVGLTTGQGRATVRFRIRCPGPETSPAKVQHMAYELAAPARCFLDQPLVPPQELRAGDIAVIGAAHGTPYPAKAEVGYDTATGSAQAPGAVRWAAIQSSSNIDHYDFDLGGPLLADGARRLVDCGDLVLSPLDGKANRTVIGATVSDVLARSAVPVLLGGDDSVPVPFLAAFGPGAPVDVLQIDAHIDWRDSIGGETFGYSSTMRRASELPFVRSITQVGMRGVGSARPQEVQAAHDWGARLVTVAEARGHGMAALAASLPTGGRLVIQVDADAFDPAVAPGVNAATPGGFLFEELAELVRLSIARCGLAGFSLVEIVPARDPSGITAIAGARLVCNAVGALCRQRTV